MKSQIYKILLFLNENPDKFVYAREIMNKFDKSFKDVYSLVECQMYKDKLIQRTLYNSYKITIHGKLFIKDYKDETRSNFIKNWISPHWPQILTWFIGGCFVIFLLIQLILK